MNKWPKIVYLADDNRVPVVEQRAAANVWVGKANSNWYGAGGVGNIEDMIEASRDGDAVGVFLAALLVPPKAHRKNGGSAGETFYKITDQLLNKGVQIYEISTGRWGDVAADLNAMIQEGRTFLAGRRPRNKGGSGRPNIHKYTNSDVLKIEALRVSLKAKGASGREIVHSIQHTFDRPKFNKTQLYRVRDRAKGLQAQAIEEASE